MWADLKRPGQWGNGGLANPQAGAAHQHSAITKTSPYICPVFSGLRPYRNATFAFVDCLELKLTRHVYCVDRNVISKIKDKSLSSEEEALLRSIDQEGNRVSPILACFEGQIGVLQTVEQLKESIEKDTAALASFFKLALTDDMAKVAHPEHMLAIVNRQKERWDANAEFVGYAQRRLYQPIAKDQLKAVQQELAQEARRLGVLIGSIFVLCALACLYQQKDAHEILKPSKKEARAENRIHNAMQDLASIGLYFTVSMFFSAGRQKIETTYITFDGWVNRFMKLTNARAGALLVTNEMVSQIKFDLSREVFPKASEADFKSICELLAATDDQPGYSRPGYAPPWYPSPHKIRIKINLRLYRESPLIES